MNINANINIDNVADLNNVVADAESDINHDDNTNDIDIDSAEINENVENVKNDGNHEIDHRESDDDDDTSETESENYVNDDQDEDVSVSNQGLRRSQRLKNKKNGMYQNQIEFV